MYRCTPFLILALALTGCTLNVNQPNLTANTAVGVGDGAQVGLGPQGVALAPTGTAPAPGASASPSGPAAPADPPGVGTKDQEALKTSIAVEASRNSRVGQTFVAGKAAPLAAIGVRLAYRGERAPDATLRLYATAAAGGPTGEPLAEAPLLASEIGKDRDAKWVVARFETPVALAAGQKYAWILEVSGSYTVVVGAGDNRAYEAGEGWSSGGSGPIWNRQGMDFAFRTYLA